MITARRSAYRAVVPVLLVGLVAVSLLVAGCGSTEPEQVIENVQNQALDAARQANLRIIDSAIQAYYAEFNKWPSTMNDLVQYFGGKLPTDPGGGTYYIVVEGGQAKAAVR